jgi:type I restriction-modification system DNA methylase subunit
MKEIMKHLEAITRKGHRPQQVFDDWVHLMVYALMRDDKKYLEVMKRYRNDGPTQIVERNGVKIRTGEREADHFAAAFGLLLQEMAQTDKELLGEIYETWELQNKYTGQFFTPWPVCSLMAQITGAPAAGQSVNDCCCGSGRLLIATCKITKAKDLDTITFYAQDVDETCVMMTALNFTFFNLNGYVYLGNSLGNTICRAFQTTRSLVYGGSIREIDPPASIPELKEQKVESPVCKPSRKRNPLQPSFFDIS